ncbi:MAG TPA: M48 family metallopeptidase [Gemmatimonadaceae bacterium]|nr:M48 family metallopeptidase [Gemmatimonadaceae bacterium]
MIANSAYRTAAKLMFAGAAAFVPITQTADAQVNIKRSPTGFNLFSVQQDVDLGRQSAAEVEKQVPLLNDTRTNTYLTRIVSRLAAQAPGTKYPYTIKAVNANEINAFALPGGPMYVHRGLITAARNEAELASVLAHEMSHVILRHGTEQASKAYLGQSGLSLLGGLVGKRGSTSSQIVQAVGGFGLNAAFLKFSRGDELEADALGTELMAKAGYDPLAMATMFAMLRAEQGRDPSKLERFFSSHPPPADREARIRTLASSLGTGGALQVVGGFPTIQSRLGGMTASATTNQPTYTTSTGTVVQPNETVTINVPAPSATFTRFRHGNDFFTVDHPNNWRTYQSGHAVSIAPEGGVVELSNGQPNLLYGVIVNHYAPFEGADDRWSSSLQRSYTPFEDRTTPPRKFLEDATDDLARTLIKSNSYLSVLSGSVRSEVIDGAQGYSVLMSGRSPVTGEEERAMLYTRALPDNHVIYMVCIAPARFSSTMDQTCSRMMRTLQVNDAAAHPRTP